MFETPSHGQAIAREVAEGITQMTVGDYEWTVGTPNFYIVVGQESAAIIDTGRGMAQEGQLLADTWRNLGSPKIDSMVVTHFHFDHRGGRSQFGQITESRSHGGTGKKAVNRSIDLGSRVLNVVATPGHTEDSLVVSDSVTGAIFTGDTIIEADSVVVCAEMSDYINSLHLLKNMEPSMLLSGHGKPITDAAGKIDAYIDRTTRREAGMLRLIERGVRTIDEMVEVYYGNHGFAGKMTARAHVKKLVDEGIVGFDADGKLILVKKVG